MITNSGAGKTTPCGEYHARAARVVRAGPNDADFDDSLFCFVCGLDEGEDPLHDEKCWPKANPSLQESDLPGVKYLREQVTEARGLPGKESTVRRLNFCEWTEAINPWISYEVWQQSGEQYDATDIQGRRAWGGLDLSSTTDLTAFVLAVEPMHDKEPWRLLAWVWVPAEGLHRKEDLDRVPYLAWEHAGHIETTPGRAISKLHVLRRVAQICQMFDVQQIAYDRWHMDNIRSLAEDEGLALPELVDHGQGYKDMAPALDDFETSLLNRTLVHNGNPALTYAAANAVCDADPAGNRKLTKARSYGRIDPLVAAVMAKGLTAKIQEESIDAFINDPVIA